MLTTTVIPTRRSPSTQIRAGDTLNDGAANGSAGVNSASDVDAGVNGATHLSGQRCRDHEDRGNSTNYRKHEHCYLPSTCSTAFMTGTLKFFSSLILGTNDQPGARLFL